MNTRELSPKNKIIIIIIAVLGILKVQMRPYKEW